MDEVHDLNMLGVSGSGLRVESVGLSSTIWSAQDLKQCSETSAFCPTPLPPKVVPEPKPPNPDPQTHNPQTEASNF